MPTDKKRQISKRLYPLYLAAFLQGFVFWYAIEKLFMTTIGFNSATIAIMVASYLSVMLIVEIPSGLLADRWSRKGVLMIAGIALALSSLIAGLSAGIPEYMLATLFYGVFFALYSGMYDSIIYDLLIEEVGNADGYEKYYGRFTLIGGIALTVASLIGGLVGQIVGLREVYFLTVPFAVLSFIVLLFFKEPKLHLKQKKGHTSLSNQMKATLAAITKKGVVLYILLAVVTAGLVGEIVFEFDQLWLIALATPVVLYGPINALLLSSVILGGSVAHYFSKHRRSVINILVMFLVASGLCLVYVRNIYITTVAIFLIATIVVIYDVMLKKQLHDRLPSNIRSGAMSTVSSFTTLLFIPTALFFGYISQKFGIFNAAWILVGLLVFTAFNIARASSGLIDTTKNNVTQLDSTTFPHK